MLASLTKGKVVVMEVPVGIGDKPPEILCTVDAVVRNLEEDGRKGVVEADEIVVGGLSNDGKEGCCGDSKG